MITPDSLDGNQIADLIDKWVYDDATASQFLPILEAIARKIEKTTLHETLIKQDCEGYRSAYIHLMDDLDRMITMFHNPTKRRLFDNAITGIEGETR